MKIIVGLGNPDQKYKTTYHNLGFIAVEEIANILNIKFKKTMCKAVVAETIVDGEKVILAKPQTYMNLSGESVRELLDYYKASEEDLLVIYDDYDLPLGSVRIRKEGSAGTHNGMRNIVENLNSTLFARVRIGFNDGSNIPLINFVLMGIKKEDYPIMIESIKKASEAGIEFIKNEKFDTIMQNCNVNKK